MSVPKNPHQITLPEWLNESFFTEVFEQREDVKGKAFRLQIVEGTAVVEAGDNFCSQMYRVKVRCQCDPHLDLLESFIVKAGKTDVAFLKERNIFGREFEMYRSAIKSFEEMWAKIGEPVSFAPKCLKVVEGDGDLAILVLSDLKQDGFVMLDRLQGLNERATLLVLEKLAKFHAASVAYREQVGDFGSCVQEKLSKINESEKLHMFMESKIQILSEMIVDWGLDNKIVEAVRGWKEVLVKEIKNISDPEEDCQDFQVLCHGDMWLNNCMFKFDAPGNDSNDPSQVILIDYQMSYWNRPHADLYNFLISSVNTNILIKQFDYFLRFYHEHLINSLQKLSVGNKRLSLKSFHMQMLENSFAIPRTIFAVLPVILLDPNDSVGIEDLLDDSDKKRFHEIERKLFNNPRVVEKLKLLLPFFYDRGMLHSTLASEVSSNGI